MMPGSNYQKVLSQALPQRLVELRPTELDNKDSERRNFGKLQLLSAYELRSKNRRFGGLSGISDDNYHALQRTLINQFLLPKLDSPGPQQ